MIKHLKSLLSPIMVVLVFTAPQMIQAMEEETVDLFHDSISDPGGMILEIAIKDRCYEFGSAGNIPCVSKIWNNFVNEPLYTSPLCKNPISLQTKYIYEIHYNTFCNGTLLYRPNPDSDEGMITLKVSDLANSLEGTFDLSGCGDTGQYLSISTGYRKGKIAENANKVEIWLAPRKFIEQELKAGRAQQFARMFMNWKPDAQVGIFWTWGNHGANLLNLFDHLTDQDNLSLCSKNLYEWGVGGVGVVARWASAWGVVCLEGVHDSKNFMLILNNQN